MGKELWTLLVCRDVDSRSPCVEGGCGEEEVERLKENQGRLGSICRPECVILATLLAVNEESSAWFKDGVVAALGYIWKR